MQADTNVSSLPLLWELALPPHKFQEALDRSVKRGLESVVITEGTNERAYLHSVTAMTAIFNNYVKLVHFDGTLLHIFIAQKFRAPDLQMIRRLFGTRLYLPDAVLHDILRDNQATFTTREATTDPESGEPEVLETAFKYLRSWEGEVDYDDIRPMLVQRNITEENTCCIVCEVAELQETRYAGTLDDDLETPIMDLAGNITTIDTMKVARSLTANPFALRTAVGKAEAYYKRSNKKR